MLVRSAKAAALPFVQRLCGEFADACVRERVCARARVGRGALAAPMTMKRHIAATNCGTSACSRAFVSHKMIRCGHESNRANMRECHRTRKRSLAMIFNICDGRLARRACSKRWCGCAYLGALVLAVFVRTDDGPGWHEQCHTDSKVGHVCPHVCRDAHCTRKRPSARSPSTALAMGGGLQLRAGICTGQRWYRMPSHRKRRAGVHPPQEGAPDF